LITEEQLEKNAAVTNCQIVRTLDGHIFMAICPKCNNHFYPNHPCICSVTHPGAPDRFKSPNPKRIVGRRKPRLIYTGQQTLNGKPLKGIFGRKIKKPTWV